MTTLAVRFDDNAPVASGAVLVEIDPRDFETRLADARAALESAEATLGNATAGLELTRIRAEARVVHLGRRTALAAGEITDAAGKVYVTATSSCLVMRPD